MLSTGVINLETFSLQLPKLRPAGFPKMCFSEKGGSPSFSVKG